MKKQKNNVFIISAPSGSGKTTLIDLLLKQNPSLMFSISHTTRPPRTGERDGVEYFFVSEEKFEQMIREDRFVEWAEVHGHYYGTSREVLIDAEKNHRDVILDIDVQGAAQVRQKMPQAISIFILPPSYEALKTRLLSRKKDSQEVMLKRLGNARKEIRRYSEFDYIIINDDLQSALVSLSSIITSSNSLREKQIDRIEAILKSFEDAEKQDNSN
jgi:guanylate kinase